MDDQTKDQGAEQNSDNQSAQTPPMVNDITPPPSTASVGGPVSAAPKIDIKVDSKDSSEELSDADYEAPEQQEGEVNDESLADEDTAPLAVPPEEESTTTEESNSENTEQETTSESDDGEMSQEPSQETTDEKPQADDGQTTESSQQSQPRFSVPSDNQDAPAAMGVAASQMNKHPHRNNKKLAAIVTIVVALLLAGVAVYVYMSANTNTESAEKSSEDTSASNSSNKQAAEVTPATSTDVETTTTEVEQAITALDETADFADKDLSDSSLGL